MGYCGLGHYEDLEEEEVQVWGPIGTSVSYSGTHDPIKKPLQQEQRSRRSAYWRGELLKSTEPDGNVNCIA